jgi:predicted DNA binding protein
MRKLILEGSIEEFRKIDSESEDMSIEKIKLFELLHVLRFDSEHFDAICRVEFKDPTTTIEEVFFGKKLKVVLLEKENEGAFTCFIKEKFPHGSQELSRMGVYLSGPCEVRDGKVKVCVLGETRQLKAFLNFIEKLNVVFKVTLLTDAKFSPRSPLSYLTEKQRAVLISAFEHGYYDMPRRIDSKELAEKLDLRSSTFIEHRRKAERRLIAGILRENVGI